MTEQLAEVSPAIIKRRERTPRILYVSSFWPNSATNAAEIRSRAVARALTKLGHVECIVLTEPDDVRPRPQQTGPELDVSYTVPVYPHPTKTAAGKLHWLLAARSAYPHGCGVTHADMRRVLRTAEKFDAIWFYKLRNANMFPCWAWSRSVVDVDDIPSIYERSFLNTAASPAQRLTTTLRMITWQRRDRLIGDRFSVLGVCSENDREYLQRLGITTPVHVIPNGFDAQPTLPVRRPTTPPRIGFIGIFDYEPNRLGIEWFARECWPQITRAFPGARLRLVGRYSDTLKPEGANIDGLGWVDDATEEMASWSAMVVPIHLGAGTRGKIAHAFSAKCPVISTSLGAYGYDVTNGVELLLAESASDFADACIKVMRQSASAEAMAERAWQRFQTKWTWDAIQPAIWATAEDCLRRSDRKTSGSSVPAALPQLQFSSESQGVPGGPRTV